MLLRLIMAVVCVCAFGCSKSERSVQVAPRDTPESDAGAPDAGDAYANSPVDEALHLGSIIPGPMDPGGFYWFGDLYGGNQANVGKCRRRGVQGWLRTRGGLGTLTDCDRFTPIREDSPPEFTEARGPKSIVVSPYNGSVVYMQYDAHYEQDARIAFFNPDSIRVVRDPKRPDVDLYTFPDDPLANDPVLPTLCPPQGFWLSPDSDGLVYQCDPSYLGYRRNTGEVYPVPEGFKVLHLGYDNHALLYGHANRPGTFDSYAMMDANGAVKAVLETESWGDPWKLNSFSSDEEGLKYERTKVRAMRAAPTGILLVRGSDLMEITYTGEVVRRGSFGFDAGTRRTVCPESSCQYLMSIPAVQGCALSRAGDYYCRAEYRGYRWALDVYLRLLPNGEISILEPFTDPLRPHDQPSQYRRPSPWLNAAYYCFDSSGTAAGCFFSVLITGP